MKTTKLIAAMLVAAFVAIYTPSISLAEEGGVTVGGVIKGGASGTFYWLKQVLELYTPTDWFLGKSSWSAGVLILFVFSLMFVLRWPLRIMLRRWFKKKKDKKEEEKKRRKEDEERGNKGIGWLTFLWLYPLIRFLVLLPMEHGEDSLDMMHMFWILLPSCLLLLFALWFKWLRGLLFAFNQGGDTIWAKLLGLLTPSPFWRYFKHSKYKKTYDEGNEEEDEDEEPPPKPKSDECPDCPKPNKNLGKKYCAKCDYVRPDSGSKVQLDECPDCPKPNKNLGKKYCTKCDYVRPDLTQEDKRPPKDPPTEAPPQTEEPDPDDWNEV